MNENKGIRVIGAGLSRTGTMSLMYALETLLKGKCLHGMKSYRHENEWCDIIAGKCTDEEFKNFFISNGYVAGVDIPFLAYYDRLLKVFPNAKVILSQREPNSWVQSMKNTSSLVLSKFNIPVFWLNFIFSEYLNGWAEDEALKGVSGRLNYSLMSNERIREMMLSVGRGDGVEFYENWSKDVEAVVPAEKLLKFSVQEGWGPLCKFLDVPIPDVPFPRANSSDKFAYYLHRNQRRAMLLIYELISLPLLCYGVFKLIR